MGDGRDPKRLLRGNFIPKKKTTRKTKIKMGGRRLDGHITNLGNTRKEKMSRRQRRIEVSSEGGRGPGGAVVS